MEILTHVAGHVGKQLIVQAGHDFVSNQFGSKESAGLGPLAPMAAGMLAKTLMPKNKDSSDQDSDAGGNGLVGTLMGAAAGGPVGLIGGIGSKWKEMSSFQRFEAQVAIAGVAYLGYNEWKKHNKSKHTDVEYKKYQQEQIRLQEQMNANPVPFSMSQGEDSPITPEIDRIQYMPYPGGIESVLFGRIAAHKLDTLDNFKSVIGSYLQYQRSRVHKSDETRVIYKHSQDSIVTYNHLMDELEYLNHQVLHGKRNKGGLLYGKPISEDLYIAAVRLFRLELFNELCLKNPLVSMFSKSIIPTFDQHPTSALPVELFGERAKMGSGKRKVGRKPTDMNVSSDMFSHVHTLFLVDDSGSMTLNGSANWSGLTDPNFGSIHVEKSAASSKKSGVMGFASGLMAKTGNFFGHSEVSSASRSVAHESVQPPDSNRDFRYQPEGDSKTMRPWFCKLCTFDNRNPETFLCELCQAPGPQAPTLPPLPGNDFSGGPKSRGIFSPTGRRETAVALTGSSRWVHVRSLLSHMTQTIAQHDPRGVDLLFLNNHSVHSGIRHGEWIQAVFDNVAPPTGGTPTGRTMHEILDAYMSTLRYDSTFKALNIVVFTDGKANDFYVLKYTIRHHIQILNRRGHLGHQLGIEFIQVGDDEIATAQLDLLEEYVDSHRGSTQKDV
ncbi:hypothetical protein CcCBS67573_g09629, partial [Chytriomyces confervae]